MLSLALLEELHLGPGRNIHRVSESRSTPEALSFVYREKLILWRLYGLSLAGCEQDIVALNGREPDIGVWREEEQDDGCTTTSRDKDQATGNHLNNMFNGHLQGVSQLSSQQRTWTSPESGNPHVTRGMKGHVEWPKNHVDVTLRAKLYEANLEQQIRYR